MSDIAEFRGLARTIRPWGQLIKDQRHLQNWDDLNL